MRSVYEVINPIPYNDAGNWGACPNWKYSYFIDLIKGSKVIVEIGSLLGASTINIAKIADDDAVIIAIDPWDQLEIHNKSCANIVKNDSYIQFLSNVIQSNQQSKIVPFRAKSEDVAKIINRKVDLLYIDGDHSENGVYTDLTSWYPHLAENGKICGDDWCFIGDENDNCIGHTNDFHSGSYREHGVDLEDFEKNLPVRRAAKRFARKNGIKKIHSYRAFWWYEL